MYLKESLTYRSFSFAFICDLFCVYLRIPFTVYRVP